MSPSDLAIHAHLERARVSRHITGLVEKKLIARLGVPKDGRRAVVELTARGLNLYAELFPKSVALNNMVLQALVPAELEAFDKALARLTEAADKISQSNPIKEKADRRRGGSRRISGTT